MGSRKPMTNEDREYLRKVQLYKLQSQTVVKPLDSGYAWLVLAASFLSNMVMDGIVYSFGMLLEEFTEAFGTSTAQATIAGSLLAGLYMSEGPILTPLIQRFGYRNVALSGSLLATVGFFVAGISGSLGLFIFAYGVLGGIAIGLNYLPSMLIVCQYFEKYRSVATGISAAGSGFGMLVFAPLTKALHAAYGWRGALIIIGALAFQTIPLALLFRELRSFYRRDLRKLHRKIFQTAAINESVDSRKSEGQQTSQAKSSSASSGDSGVATSPAEVPNDAVSEPLIRGNSTRQRLSHSISHPDDSTAPNSSDNQIKISMRRRIKSETYPMSEAEASIEEAGRPFDRIDILYTGSHHQLQQYKNALAKSREIVASESSEAGQKQAVRTEQLAEELYTKEVTRPRPVGHFFRHTVSRLLNDMFAFSMLKQPSFDIYLLGNFFAFTGILVVTMFVPNQARQNGADAQQQALVIVIVGAMNTIGRIVFNIIAQKLRPSGRLVLHNSMTILSGVVTLFLPYCSEYWMICVCCGLFGLFMAPLNSMTQLLLVDLCGLRGLTSTFGLMCMVRGTAWFLGPPIAGAIKDATNSYTYTFFCGGGAFIFAGLILCLLHIPKFSKRDDPDALPQKVAAEEDLESSI